MGFQQRVPPLPSRQQEMHMMKKLQESWLNQHYLKYYMNENLRQPKMAFASRQNQVRRQFMLNFLMYGVALIPVALFCRRLVLFQGRNTPTTYAVSNFIHRDRSAFETRVKNYNKLGAAIWLGLNTSLCFWTTNFQPVQDQTYKHMSKSKKML